MEAKVIITDNTNQSTRIVSGNTDNEVCFALYEIIRMYRYCNGTHAEFASAEWKKKMKKWYESGHPTMDEYYGGGIVD